MCRQKESKAREREEKGNFGSSTHSSGYDSSFLSFLSASLSNTRSSYSSTGFSLFFSVFFFSFLSLAILTSEARKEIRVAPWHRLSVHFTRFAVGAITYEFPLSSRFLLFPLSLASFSRSFRYRSTVQLKTVHSFRALSSNSVGRSSLGSSSAGSFAFS